MVAFIAKLLHIKKRSPESEVRRAFGVLCGGIGIFLNIMLFIGKIIAGSLTHSLSITADAFNNLSDAGSSLISLIGFGLSGKAPDPEHPFGHGRIEYVSGLCVSFLILLMGGELIKSSVERIITPEKTEFGMISIVVLGISILIKFYMFFYNNKYGKCYDSPTMRATAKDSLSDAASTAVVLIASLVEHLTGLQIDSWCGLLIALFIIYAGITSAKDTLDPLLGTLPSGEMVKEIESIVLSEKTILGIHDMIVHDYGPGRSFISLHAEVPCDGDILAMHDVIDNIEAKLMKRFDCVATIHMDPIQTSDSNVAEIRARVNSIVNTLFSDLTIHDLRVVTGPTHTNIIFDIVVPYGYKMKIQNIKDSIEDEIKQIDPSYCTVINIDRPYA